MKDAKQSKVDAASSKPPERKMPKITEQNLVEWLRSSLAIHSYMDERVSKMGMPNSKALDMSSKITSDLANLGGPSPPSAPLSSSYVDYLSTLPDHRFLNHYYNLKNAHFAGGLMFHRMIQTNKHRALSFYDEVEERDQVKGEIDDVAGGWGEEEREEALAETKKSFEWQGKIVGLLMGGGGGH